MLIEWVLPEGRSRGQGRARLRDLEVCSDFQDSRNLPRGVHVFWQETCSPKVCVLCKLSLIFSTYSLRNFMGHHFVRQRTIPFKNTDSTKSLCIKWGTRKLSPNPLLSVSGWMSALKSKSHRGPQLCPTTSAHHPALAFRQNQDLPREGESHTRPCFCTLMASIGLCGTLQVPWGECFWSLVCVSPSVSQKELI